ncbi:MAG TPA: hypothetical protein VFV96_17335 [Verrucomicrobiae bacterium]|nr:hypothetical protein [Verrucomicrobiae bacterium]
MAKATFSCQRSFTPGRTTLGKISIYFESTDNGRGKTTSEVDVGEFEKRWLGQIATGICLVARLHSRVYPEA